MGFGSGVRKAFKGFYSSGTLYVTKAGYVSGGRQVMGVIACNPSQPSAIAKASLPLLVSTILSEKYVPKMPGVENMDAHYAAPRRVLDMLEELGVDPEKMQALSRNSGMSELRTLREGLEDYFKPKPKPTETHTTLGRSEDAVGGLNLGKEFEKLGGTQTRSSKKA